LSVGMEAMYLSPTNAQSPNGYNGSGNTSGSMVAMKDNKDGLQIKNQLLVPDPNFIPNVVSFKSIPTPRPDLIDRGGDVIDFNDDDDGDDSHLFIPILAIRRQRIGNEERFHEDPSIVDIQVTHLGTEGLPPTISDEADSDSDDFGRGSSAAASKLTSIMTRIQSNNASDILSKTQWTLSTSAAATEPSQQLHCLQPVLMVRRNVPDGFSDIPFASAKVLDRFPQKNYRGMPFPEEEMPLFCYPGGIYLVRDKLSNWKLPRSLGFVMKNERGDSIFGEVALLTFCE